MRYIRRSRLYDSPTLEITNSEVLDHSQNSEVDGLESVAQSKKARNRMQ